MKHIAPVATGAALVGMALYPQRPLHAEAPDVRNASTPYLSYLSLTSASFLGKKTHL